MLKLWHALKHTRDEQRFTATRAKLQVQLLEGDDTPPPLSTLPAIYPLRYLPPSALYLRYLPPPGAAYRGG